MATSAGDDPLGLVTSPPTTIVKVKNTAREDMNGKLGIVVQYNSDRGRYLVHLTEKQSTVALKADNLEKANYFDQAKAQYQQLSNDPRVRQELQRLQARLPFKIEYLAGGVLGGIALSFYLIGFSRTLMIVSFTMLVLMIAGPDLFASNTSFSTVVKNFPNRFRTMIREQIPTYGNTIANNDYMLMAIAAIALAFFAKAILGNVQVPFLSSLMGGSSPPTTTTAPIMPQPPRVDVPPAVDVKATLEEFYRLGFEDSQGQKDFGSSIGEDILQEALAKMGQQQQPRLDVHKAQIDSDMSDEFGGYSSVPPSYYGTPPPQKKSLMSKINFSTLGSLFYIGNTVYQSGVDAGGWSMERAKQNLMTLDMWKMAIMGLSIYKVVEIFR